MSARRGTPLTIDEICTTALRLAEENGVEALSMRKLAAELQVNPMSLYHHVENKEALIRLLCTTVNQRIKLPADDGSPWEDQLRRLAIAYHEHTRIHANLWAYLHQHPEIISDRKHALWQALYRILRLAGVPESELRRTSDVLHAFVTGFIMAETQGHLPADPEEIERDFDTAVQMIIHGLAGFSTRAA